jgi:hypothetical protein
MAPVGVGDEETGTYRTDAIEEDAVPRRRAGERTKRQACDEKAERGVHVPLLVRNLAPWEVR